MVQQAANQFSSVATLLSNQSDMLNNATQGLLWGDVPWTGTSADAFFEAWQLFGWYIQQLQGSCQDASNSLNKLSNQLISLEDQAGWNGLLMLAGGIITAVSIASEIATFGINPLGYGGAAAGGKLTAQEGADVLNVSEEIEQADSETTNELQQVDDSLTNSPTLPNGMNANVDAIPDGLTEANLDEMTSTSELVDTEIQNVDGESQGLSNTFWQRDPGDVAGSGLQLTSTGDEYLQEIKDMGVTVYDSNDDPDMANFMIRNGARGGGVTWFNGLQGEAGPGTTTIILGPDADNAAVYEEYLHVQRGAARGWVSLDPEDALVEEIEVEEQVLSKSAELDITPAKYQQIQQNIADYRQQLWEQYHKTVP